MYTAVQLTGGLRCRVIDDLPTGASPKALVILNHGFGAPGDDLADFGPMLIESSDAIAASCRFVFPEAPVDLAPLGMPGGRAWWPINMAGLAQMHATQDFSALTQIEPPGMTQAAQQLASSIDAMLATYDRKPQLILGGFSQGAMVSTQVTLDRSVAPALLLLYSGTLLWRDRWTQLAAAHGGTRVFQSHGHDDQILPMSAARQLNELLTANRFATEFLAFRGGHTIPPDALARTVQLIELVCGRVS